MKARNVYTRREFIRTYAAGICSIFGGVSLAGCSNAPTPLIGKWKTTSGSETYVEFKTDGTLSYSVEDSDELAWGKWYAYKNNPVDVNGEKWYVYTTDNPLAPVETSDWAKGTEFYGKRNGEGTYSEDIGGEYQYGRIDFAVNGDLMYGAIGFSLTSDDKFDEEAIIDYLSEPSDLVQAYLAYTRV